jgi:hypothetical protein
MVYSHCMKRCEDFAPNFGFEVIEVESQAVLNTIKEHFQDALKKQQKRYERHICAEGDYFEVDGGQWA